MNFPFPFLTADDWGLSPAINRGILELAQAGLIRRVSVMTKERFVSDGLSELQKIPGIELGLHFDLTHSFHRSPSKLLWKWMSASPKKRERLRAEARRELRDQIAAVKNFGIRLAHFDSHQHTHLIPGIFRALSDELRGEKILKVRIPFDTKLLLTGKFPLVALSLLAKQEVAAAGFETRKFYYPQLSEFENVDALKNKFEKNSLSEILVHPATGNDFAEHSIHDSYADERVFEYEQLKKLSALFAKRFQNG